MSLKLCKKSTCLRPLKGHPKPTGDKCQLPDRQISQDVFDEIKNNDLEFKKQAQKRFTEKRKKCSETLENHKLKDKKRKLLERKKNHCTQEDNPFKVPTFL